jgi:adenine deaminase
MEYSISGNIVDIINKIIFPGRIYVQKGRIKKIIKTKKSKNIYLIPGLIDAHVHIESSMLIPSEFSRIAVIHGTVGAVSDPHEIANVLGIEGVKFMKYNGKRVPFKFYFGVPSCVPATDFETSGGRIDIKEIKELFLNQRFKYLAEIMNFQGVINNDETIMSKINLAKNLGKKIDGHAPGLSGNKLKKYISAGISTDHECMTYKEGEEKIKKGMKILIREGSAAKNFNELIPLIKKFPENIMLCSDDIHPDDLLDGHINRLIKLGIDQGYNFFDMIRAATLNPNIHYNLDNGLLRENDPADFVIIDNPDNISVLETYINGLKVFENGRTRIKSLKSNKINVFNCNKIKINQIIIPEQTNTIRVIEAFDGQLYTRELIIKPTIKNGKLISDIKRDILKIVVYNRYNQSTPQVSFIKGFGLKKGAIASTIAHDSHNIIAIGVTDRDIVIAINRIIELRGGILLFDSKKFEEIQLNVAGLMTDRNANQVAKNYRKLNRKVQLIGSKLSAPFMTLSFMALLVIPELKMSDKGLFSVKKFNFTDLFYSDKI